MSQLSNLRKSSKSATSSDVSAPLPAVDPEQLKKVYEAPAQDKTRIEYAHRYQQAQDVTNVNAGGEGLKNATSTFENSWYVATALVMTIGFAMILYVPDGFSVKNGEVISAGDWIAVCTYFILVIFGTVNSSLGVWWAGHGVAQVDWHPAVSFGFFWFASLNTTMGQCQQFAKAGIVQLVLALVPLSYMQYGYFGLAASAFAMAYAYMQILTWQKMGGLMREGFKTGLSQGSPVVLDVADVPPVCKRPFSADLVSMATGQFGNTFGYAFRGWFGGQAAGGGKQACWMNVASGKVVAPTSGLAATELTVPAAVML